jgi:hypothetical protein
MRPQFVVSAGTWEVEFANGVKETCEIKNDGTASVVEPARSAAGKATIADRSFVIAFEDNRVERWTPIGNRMIVEHWVSSAVSRRVDEPAGQDLRILIPTSAPVLGIGERGLR